jgi:outer membrane biosynthesis protein TonB
MRISLLISALLHGAILAWAVVGLPGADAYNTAPVEVLPIELVSIEDFTDLATGSAEADPEVETETAARETVEAETPSEAPGETATPTEDTLARSEDASELSQESTAPEPSGVTEASEEEEAPPVETEVAALPPAESEPEPAPEATPEPAPAPVPEPQPEVEAEPEPQQVAPRVVPRRRPTPPPRAVREAREQRSNDQEFDADRISALLYKVQPTGGGSGGAQARLGVRDGRPAARMTLAELDALRQQIQRCWNPPIGARGADELVVEVRMLLNPDGSVDGLPDVQALGVGPFFDAAADSARRAVLQCQPYVMPVEKYEFWREVSVRFDPRELF